MLFMLTADSSSYTFLASQRTDENNTKGYENQTKEMLNAWMKRYRNEKLKLPNDRIEKLNEINFYDAIDDQKYHVLFPD